MAKIVVYVFLAAMVACCFAAPGERVRRHYNGGYPSAFGGGGGGGGGFGGLGGRPGGHGAGAIPLNIGGSQSYSKSSASASSQSGSGGGYLHG